MNENINKGFESMSDENLENVSGGYKEVTAYNLEPGDTFIGYHDHTIYVYVGPTTTVTSYEPVLVDNYEVSPTDPNTFIFDETWSPVANIVVTFRYIGKVNNIKYKLVK